MQLIKRVAVPVLKFPFRMLYSTYLSVRIEKYIVTNLN